MNLLVVAATEAEIAQFRAFVTEKGLTTDILVTGVGMVATAYALTRQLATKRYDLALQVGVAGSYDLNLAPGSMVFVTSDQYGDLGAEDHEAYLDIFEMGLAEKNKYPYTDGRLLTPRIKAHERIKLPEAAGLTINTVSGSEPTIKMRIAKFAADIETMEGAAFHEVCLRENMNFAQVRSISNYVTPRDKSQWQMGPAIANLNKWLIEFVDNI